MTLDGFFGRAYHRRFYNCAHFSIEVWETLTGRKVEASIAGFLIPGNSQGKLGHASGVTLLTRPVDPCFVLMRSLVREPHVGVFHEGKIIHLAGNHRVQNQPPDVVTLGYTRVRYFTC